MSARVHVLLLAEADPEPAHLRGWLEARLRRPGGAPGPRWVRRLLARLYAWWRAPRLLPALPGPSPLGPALGALAAALQRVLGPRYAVHVVLRGGEPGLSQALATVRAGEAAVLLAADPIAGLPAEAHVRAALAARQLRVTAADPLSTPAFAEALAAPVRAALPALGAPAWRLCCVAAAPEGARPRVEAAAARLARALGRPAPDAVDLVPPFGSSADGTGPYRALARPGAPVVIVPIGPLVAHAALTPVDRGLLDALRGLGVPALRAEPPGPAPALARACATAIRAAERAAGWEVPEDAVDAAVAAALRAEGARCLA